MSDVPHMHVFAQGAWHDSVEIVADTKALLGLKKAIEDALATGSGFSMAFVGDGEGYNILIARTDDEKVFDTLAVPYTEEMASEKNDTAVLPYTLEGIEEADKAAVAELNKAR